MTDAAVDNLQEVGTAAACPINTRVELVSDPLFHTEEPYAAKLDMVLSNPTAGDLDPHEGALDHDHTSLVAFPYEEKLTAAPDPSQSSTLMADDHGYQASSYSPGS
ncbi:hypothetical protein DV738_g2219, partial [Chaetothyriales sp. CBS 135597]